MKKNTLCVFMLWACCTINLTACEPDMILSYFKDIFQRNSKKKREQQLKECNNECTTIYRKALNNLAVALSKNNNRYIRKYREFNGTICKQLKENYKNCIKICAQKYNE